MSRVPVDACKQAGQRGSVLAKVVTSAGKPLQLHYVAVLPKSDGN
jgi:hypothetical protein